MCVHGYKYICTYKAISLSEIDLEILQDNQAAPRGHPRGCSTLTTEVSGADWKF